MNRIVDGDGVGREGNVGLVSNSAKGWREVDDGKVVGMNGSLGGHQINRQFLASCCCSLYFYTQSC